MRIKRFIAPDMRTALRMVREEQGPDAVILSNRAAPGGIEVVAATDYDESLVTQALRAAAPGLEAARSPAVETTAAEAASSEITASETRTTATRTTSFAAAPSFTQAAPVALAQRNAGAPVVASRTAAPSASIAIQANAHSSSNTTGRGSLMSRARAVFKVDDGPTLAELTAAMQQGNATPAAPASVRTPAIVTAAKSRESNAPASHRFDAMMAALNPADTARNPDAGAQINPALATRDDSQTSISLAASTRHTDDVTASGYPAYPKAGSVSTGRVPHVNDAAALAVLRSSASGHEHAADAETDASAPVIAAMRKELAAMRQLMEKQMEQLSLERLRGSPARAAAFDALIRYGCDDTLAQAIAASIDPSLAPSQIHEPMIAEVTRRLTIARGEPIDEGGVIALIGPTGAGKTMTAAKLAARFAARYRARDVALVSIDRERSGAREQLHAHGRRLGVTVCDADSSDALGDALEQLTDYPLVLVDTAGYGISDRALLRQILWLRSSSRLRSLLVLPANAHPHDLAEIVRRYRPAAPQGVVLTKLDETGRLGAALSVLIQQGQSLAYTSGGQQIASDLDIAETARLTRTLEKSHRAADNPLVTEDRHAFA